MEERNWKIFAETGAGALIPLATCAGCNAIVAAGVSRCLRCTVSGTPQEEREKRLSKTAQAFLVFLVHAPVLIGFRVAFYYYLRLPIWLWVLFVVEMLVWFFQASFGIIALTPSKEEAKAEESRKGTGPGY